MINENISAFKTIEQVKTHFNSYRAVKQGNILQVQDADFIYHYLVENMQGWNELGITSLTDYFTDKE